MSESTATHGIEIIKLVSASPGGIRLDQLAESVATRFGKATTYYTCTTQGMSLEALLKLLAMRHKVRINNGKVFPGRSPICKHCRYMKNIGLKGPHPAPMTSGI